jgi:hypothetical protein
MGNVTYRDLAEFGLPLFTPDRPEFSSLVEDIERRPQPFGSWPIDDLGNAAVLLNESGNTILGMSYFWRNIAATGQAQTMHCSNLGSSVQLDVFAGRMGVPRDLGTFILAGSKRLITERGIFGNNLDVICEEDLPRGGGYSGARGGGARTHEETVATELILDAAILDDGRCVGPDEYGLFGSVVEDLERIRNTAEEGARALRNGATAGEIFELLRPLARKGRGRAPERGGKSGSPFLAMFARMAIHQLIDGERAAIAEWLETQAQPPRLRLHRAS